MSDIERELREVLQRKQPSLGFHGLVIEQARLSRHAYQRRLKWISAAMAACLMIGVIGAYWERQRQAERAHEQLLQALQITAQKLTLVERIAAKNLARQGG